MILALLFLFFVVFPVVELTVIIAVGGQIGVIPTIGLLFLVGAIGAWLSKREGASVLRRINASLNQGQAPTTELIDGGLILFAGVLMVAPGFVSDILGIVLLLPPVRKLVRMALMKRFKGRLERATTVGGPAGFTVFSTSSAFGPGGDRFGGGFRSGRFGDVLDTTSTDAPPPGGRRPEIGTP